MHVLEWSLAVTGRGLALFLGTANVYLTSFALFYFAQRGHAAASLLEVLSGSVRDVSAAVGCAVSFFSSWEGFFPAGARLGILSCFCRVAFDPGWARGLKFIKACSSVFLRSIGGVCMWFRCTCVCMSVCLLQLQLVCLSVCLLVCLSVCLFFSL